MSDSPAYRDLMRRLSPVSFWPCADQGVGSPCRDLIGPNHGPAGAYTGTAIGDGRQTYITAAQHPNALYSSVYATIPDANSLDQAGPFTFAIWFVVVSVASTRSLASKGSVFAGGSAGWDLYIFTDSKVYFDAKVGGVNKQLGSTNTVSTNTVYFQVVDFDGSTMRQFRNDAGQGTLAASGACATNTAPMYLGARAAAADAASAPMAGGFWNAALFDRLLTPAERTALYRAGRGIRR